jgi:hypothetical protein
MSAAGEDVKYAFEAIWKVLIAAVILGAGLPALFAGGIRSLAWAEGGSTETSADGTPAKGNPIGWVIAAVLFLIVAYGLVIGIYYVIATGHGKELQFNSIWPEQVKKK